MKSPAKINRMWEIIVFHKIESCPKLSKEAKGSLPQARLESMKKSL